MLAARVDEAQDLIAPLAARRRWSRVLSGTSAEDSAVLVSAFEAAVRLGEISSAMMARERPVPAVVGETADSIGRQLLRPGWRAALPAAWRRDGKALSDAARADALVLRMAGVLEAASRGDLEPLGAAPHRPPVPLRERARLALLLAAAIVVASVAGYALHGPRGYWLPLALAFIFRPDLGPVTRRAAGRTAGTAVGVRPAHGRGESAELAALARREQGSSPTVQTAGQTAARQAVPDGG